MILVGDGVSFPGMSGHLAPELCTDVTVAQTADLDQCPTDILRKSCEAGALTTAIGLAQFDEKNTRCSNLISAQRRQAKRRHVRARRWVLAFGAYVLLLLLIYAGCCVIRGKGRGVVVDEIAEIRLRIKDSNRELASAKTELTEVQLKLAGNRAVGRQADWGLFLAILSESVGKDIVLNRFRLHPEKVSDDPARKATGDAATPPSKTASGHRGFGLEMKGYGKSRTAVPQFALRLEEMRLFDRVALKHTKQESTPDGEVISFRMVCLLVNGGKSVQ